MTTARPWRTVAGTVVVRVRLTPNTSREAVDGIEVTAAGSVLKARVRAVPEDGKANAALESLIAAWLGVSKRAVAVVGGRTSRVKTMSIRGDASAIAARLDTLTREL